MRLNYILLAVASILAYSDTAVTADQTSPLKFRLPNLARSNDITPSNDDNRILRMHDVNTDDEERTVNLKQFKKIFDFKKWFGMGKNSAANVAIRNSKAASKATKRKHAVNNVVKKEPAVNNAGRNQHITGDVAITNTNFDPVTLKNMLDNPEFKSTMFTRWDKFTMEKIKTSIGETNLNNEAIAKMVVDYVQNVRVYKKNYLSKTL
ncbi:Secreted RxLR effector peptide protein [Phytophthora palmivora]|uniref:RxLR effector protein n=1 Tax=Phytophthora palmivora TaxID=4796 RepID=A0A2P4Y561_9STRA|nr:Secreted RxLR effector peptide protein [Phytophthora palmivora]